MGVTATLLRQDKHVNDVVFDFGRQLHTVNYNENPQAVNIHMDKLAFPPSTAWVALVNGITNFEKRQIAEALSPVNLMAVMGLLVSALVQGRQGLVFFGRRAVQDIYYEFFRTAGVARIHGGTAADKDDNAARRAEVRDRIATYDRTSSEMPTNVLPKPHGTTTTPPCCSSK